MTQLFTVLEQISKNLTAEAQRRREKQRREKLVFSALPLRLCGKALCFSGLSGLGDIK
jgi:hypothetical protein